MVTLTFIIVCVAIGLSIYTIYKYLFYSAFCNPRNALSLELNSFLNMLGLGTDFLFWVIPALIFFWPTKG